MGDGGFQGDLWLGLNGTFITQRSQISEGTEDFRTGVGTPG